MKSVFHRSPQAGSPRAPLFRRAHRLARSRLGTLTLTVALLAAVFLFTLMSFSLTTRAADPNRNVRNPKRTLTGNWMVTVSRINPAPGQAPSFLTLVTYFEDGNLIHESNSADFNGAGRGNWVRTGPHEFTLSFVFFRFDAARTYLGT